MSNCFKIKNKKREIKEREFIFEIGFLFFFLYCSYCEFDHSKEIEKLNLKKIKGKNFLFGKNFLGQLADFFTLFLKNLFGYGQGLNYQINIYLIIYILAIKRQFQNLKDEKGVFSEFDKKNHVKYKKKVLK